MLRDAARILGNGASPFGLRAQELTNFPPLLAGHTPIFLVPAVCLVFLAREFGAHTLPFGRVHHLDVDHALVAIACVCRLAYGSLVHV
jgi:hypothetical protein